MNTYFEQTAAAANFYNPQGASEQAAYRFPLGLSVSPYHAPHPGTTPTPSGAPQNGSSRGAPPDPPGTAYESMGSSSAAAVAAKLYGHSAAASVSPTVSGSSPLLEMPYKDCSPTPTSLASSTAPLSSSSSGVKLEPLPSPSPVGHAAFGSAFPTPAGSSGFRYDRCSPAASWNHPLNNAAAAAGMNAAMQSMSSHQFYPWMAIAGEPWGFAKICTFFRHFERVFLHGFC